MRPKRRRPIELLTEYDMRSIRQSRNVSEGQTPIIFPQKRIERSGSDISEIDEELQRPKSSSRLNIVWILLIAYSLFLVYNALLHNQDGNMANTPLWNFQDSQQLLAWMKDIVLRGFWKFAYFIPVGLMATLIFASLLDRFRQLSISLFGVLLASIFAVLVQAVENNWSWHLVTVVGLVLPVLGCAFGTWMGTTWLRGRRACLWFIPKVAGLVILIGLCTGLMTMLSVEQRPLSFEPAQVTSAEKRRLTYLIRSKSPRSLIEGQTQTLRLTQDDINVLLSWGLSLGSPDRKARVDLRRDSASLAASINIIPGSRKKRYLNLMVTGVPVIEEEALNLNVNRFRLGNLEAPRWLLNLLSPVVTSLLRNDRRSRPFLDATRALTIDQNFMEVTYGPLILNTHGFREEIFGPATAGQEVLASTRAQVENLLAVVNQLPETQPDFGQCFETVFSLARDRSINGDPVTENRAGIFAIGILLGHPRIEEFLGPVHVGRDKYAARRALSRVDLRGRSDWTKHFCVAAAIALLSDEVVSNAASVLKEELDADIGGSGFSFSDMLAARSGTTFAVQATSNKKAALAMQERIIGGFRVEEYFPPAADLPEGITDAQLQSEYGGVGGDGYNHLIEEMERRISTCAAYLKL